ncbi:MAG: hypothetical protein Q6363_002855, partial [Candidatus Njordarchaeota archaeon]
MEVRTFRIVLEAEENKKLDFTGHLIRATLLRIIKTMDPEIAKELHSPREKWGLAPYAIRPLKPANTKKQKILYYPVEIDIKEDEQYDFEISIFDEKIVSKLIEIIPTIIGETIEIGGAGFRITKLQIEKNRIEKIEIDKKITIIFQTPTYFRSKERPGRNILLPLPELIINSAAKIYYTFFSKQKIDTDTKEIIEKLKQNAKRYIKIIKHTLRTVKPINIGKN